MAERVRRVLIERKVKNNSVPPKYVIYEQLPFLTNCEEKYKRKFQKITKQKFRECV